MRSKVYQTEKIILNQENKPILTSMTIPNWQVHRIAKTRKELTNKLNKAIPEGEIELLALKLYIKRMSPRKLSAQRAVRYNEDNHCYTKINIRFENTNDYFLFRNKRSHLRVSVSFLMDLALRMYLHVAARILYLKLTKGEIKKKWTNIIDHFSIYKENIHQDSNKTLHINEIHLMNYNSS